MQVSELMKFGLDRRRDIRVTRPVQITYQGDQHRYRRSIALDISQSGAQILAFNEQDVTDEMKLTFHLDTDSSVTLIGRPVWKKPAGNGISKVGLQFTAYGLGGSAYLNNWINRNIA